MHEPPSKVIPRNNDSPKFKQPKVIVGRCLVNYKKKHIVEGSDFWQSWKKKGASMMHEARSTTSLPMKAFHIYCPVRDSQQKAKPTMKVILCRHYFWQCQCTWTKNFVRKTNSIFPRGSMFHYRAHLIESIFHHGLRKMKVQLMFKDKRGK